jgi:hypothetical protein
MTGSSSWLRFLARAACAVSALLILAAAALLTVLGLDSSYVPEQSLADSVPDIIMALSFSVVGAILTLKRPDNLVGWALALAGFGQLLGGVLGLYGELALLAKPEAGLPAGAAAARIGQGAWTPLMAGVFLLLVVFPSGRFPSPRWRTIALFVLSGFALVWLLITTSAGTLDPPFEAYENPLAVTDSHGYVVAVFPLIGVCLAFIVVAGVDLLRRFRRSRGEERQQFKWFAASAGFLVLVLPFAGIFNWSGVAGGVFTIALIALPVSVGIAVLRYRLYELDVIVRRTLVYGVVSAALAGLYFAIVLLLQQVFSSFAGGSDLAIAGSTLAVAALFRPVRNRIQALVDRRFFRRKYDTQRTLEAFSARLREEVDLDTLHTELLAVVDETMKPSAVSLWLRSGQ